PPPPFPQRLKKKTEESKYRRFISMLKQLSINVPLIEALEIMHGAESVSKVQVEERLGVETLSAVMMNFDSDGIEEYNELVAALNRCEYRSKPMKLELDMKNFVEVPLMRDDVSTTDGVVRVTKSPTEDAMMDDVGTTEGDLSIVPAGSGKPDPLAC
uniref:Integrase core domain containing protein n=1 Tax=Solanum tuberosum TaxID=4113 RepID=M1DPF1_SOLTU